MQQMISTVNGLPFNTPELATNIENAQEKLDGRFLGEGATEGGRMFVSKDEHDDKVKRDSGASATFGGYENAQFLESKIQGRKKRGDIDAEPVTYKPAGSE